MAHDRGQNCAIHHKRRHLTHRGETVNDNQTRAEQADQRCEDTHAMTFDPRIVARHSRDVVSAVAALTRSRLGGRASRGGVAILIDHTGRMLLVHPRYRRWWNLPGGFLNQGEDPEAGIRRELTEEVAYPPEAPGLQVAVTLTRRNHDDHIAVAQLDRATAIKLHIVTWELREMRWCSPTEMPPLPEISRGAVSAFQGLVVADDDRWTVVAR
jgi:8-oxo-dGTP diphosphatase